MGNSPKNVSAFTKNWRQVAPSLLRNQLTHELIEQHFLRFHNVDDQNIATQLLAKRIRLHHSHVVKLIYYAPEYQNCTCSALDKPYRTQVYTEYPGDCLIGFVRVNNMPLKYKGCPCFSVLQGAMYLQQHYGSFEVAEDRVFMDLQQLDEKQPLVKVWIHPDKAQLHPRRPCIQEQMVQSLLSVYQFIVGNGFCKNMTVESLQAIKTSTKLPDLKTELIKAHNSMYQDEGRHTKSFSAIESKNKLNFIGDKIIQSTQIRFNSKPVSLPHQQNQTSNQSKTNSFNTNQNKKIFMHSTPTNQFKNKFEDIPARKHEVNLTKQYQTVSTQPITPKGLNQQINEYHAAFKQQNQRVRFNYMSAEPHNTDKKYVYPMKYGQILRNVKEDNNNRERVYSNYGLYSRGTQFQKQKSINIENALRVVKNLQFKNGEPIVINSQPYQEKLHQNYPIKQTNSKQVYNPPQNISTNLQNTISNSQPSAFLIHLSVSNSQQNNIYESLSDHVKISQLKSNQSFQISHDDDSFAALQMQIPLRQNSFKNLPSYLPTTSRSPKREKDCVNIHPISQVSEALDGKEGHLRINQVSFNDSMFSSKKSNRKPNASSVSKNQKIERYTKEIKDYQQNIRQRLSSSAGNKKFTGFVQNMLKPETRSDKPAQFKQTKSIYNDSEYKPMEGSHQSLSIDTFLRPESRFQEKNRTQQSEEQKQLQDYEKELKMSYLKKQKHERDQMKKMEEQRQKQKQKEFELQRLKQIAFEQKRKIQAQLERQAREKHQKLQLQRDLECERKNIQSEMNDLLRQNAMKDEYRSIREKVKQKKQTFAQLKAEATKILEDCLY